jgi:predicted thioesterase
MTPLKPGLTGTAELIVGPEHTAESVGSGKVGVLATPVMINVIEAAALAAIDPHLAEGHQSLGTFLQVSHIAATPVGMRVSATAELVKVDGRHLELKVRAEDEVEEIGSGMHYRIVVNVGKFDARVAKKLNRPG